MKYPSRFLLRRASRLSTLALLSSVLAACGSTMNSTMNTGEDGPTVATLSRSGPHQIRAYISMPDAPEFAGATIYYPLNTTGLLGGVAVAPGFTEKQRHINWWGSLLATHGYAVIILDTNDTRERPEARAEALMAGVRTLRAEGQREGSPLNGRIDTTRMAIMGHSMGGGGALLAANAHSEELSAAIPFTPWQPSGDFSDITIPTLVIAGEADTIAPVAEHAWPHYQSIPEGTPRAFLELKAGDHFIANSSADERHALMGRYGIAWLKLYMDGDERYRQFIDGAARQEDDVLFSRYTLGK